MRQLSCVLTALTVAAGAMLVTPGHTQPAADDGKQLFEKRCGGCHALDRDQEGPRLGGVYGRAAASVKSYEYSVALQKSHLAWDAQTLDRWLEDPDKLVPGNNMDFHVESADERSVIIAYLRQSSAK